MKKSEAKEVKRGYFEGLVDLAIGKDGGVVYLIVEHDAIVEKRDVTLAGTKYIPPPREALPFELPRVAEVIRWYNMQ